MKVIVYGQLADHTLISDRQHARATVLDGEHMGHTLQIVTAKPLGEKYYRKYLCDCGRNVSDHHIEIVSAENVISE